MIDEKRYFQSLQLLFRTHVRADVPEDDYSDQAEEEDRYMDHLLRSAHDTACFYIGLDPMDTLESDYNGTHQSFYASSTDSAFTQAVLMIAAHWYNQREAVSPAQMHEVPIGAAALLKPYKHVVWKSKRDRNVGGKTEI